MDILSTIHAPEDVKKLSLKECGTLAKEIRKVIVHTVAQNGGHLSSNLGTVELTLALHRCFSSPQDQIVFDVGHQSYTHKLVTGRYDRFSSLRTHGGLCGFPRRAESPCDVFETGHASTSVSAALGLARARDLQGQNYHVVAVIGDGSITGGMSYEALSDAGYTSTRLIVVLNDNGMSIARNVGALSLYFSRLRSTSGYIRTKRSIKSTVQKIPMVGKPIYAVCHHIKVLFKRLFIGEGYFSSMGFHYIGPVDGHNIRAMEKAFHQAMQLDEPVLVHCQTIKGHGYPKAEEEPEIFHGISPFSEDENGISKDALNEPESCGTAANNSLIRLAAKNQRICVVTAAMPLGTGTSLFKAVYPKRFFDVGIAEEHAVTFSAGMARGGMLPILFIYSTFLQRGYDQVLHDMCMQGLHAVFMIDRAGFATADGKTHHGIYDIAYLRHIPGITILSPASNEELCAMLRTAAAMEGAVAIRYPKAFGVKIPFHKKDYVTGCWEQLLPGKKAVLLAVGTMLEEALALAKRFGTESLRVINASCIKPLDTDMLTAIARDGLPVFTLEEHAAPGGFGSAVLEWTAQNAPDMAVYVFGVPDMWIEQGTRTELLRDAGLDTDTLEGKIRAVLQERDGMSGS